MYKTLDIPEELISEIETAARKEIRNSLDLKTSTQGKKDDEYLPQTHFSIMQYACLTTIAVTQHKLYRTDDTLLISTTYRRPINFDDLVDFIIGSLREKTNQHYNPCFFFHIQSGSVILKKFDEIPLLRCLLCLHTPIEHRRSSTTRELFFRWIHNQSECNVKTLFQPPFKEDWPPKRTFVGLFYGEIEKLMMDMDMDIKIAQDFWKHWRTAEDRGHNLYSQIEPSKFCDELFENITAGNPKIDAFKVKCLQIAGNHPNEEQKYCEQAKFTTLFHTLCPGSKSNMSFNLQIVEDDLKLPNVNWNTLSKSDDDDDVLDHIARYQIRIRPNGICGPPTSPVLCAIFDIVKFPELKRLRTDDVGKSCVTAYPSYIFLKVGDTHPLLTICGTFAIVPSCIHPISPFAQCERLGSYKAILKDYFLNNPIMNAIKEAILNFHEKKTTQHNIVINMDPFPTIDDVVSKGGGGGGVYKIKLSKKQSQKRKKTRKMLKIKKYNKSKKNKNYKLR